MKSKKLYLFHVAIILIAIFSFQTIYKGWLLTDYLIHTEKYELNCINKAKPKMHCDGKCQLSKMVNDTDSDNSTKNVNQVSKYFEFIFYQDSRIQLNLPVCCLQSNQVSMAYHSPQGYELTYIAFRPPIFVL